MKKPICSIIVVMFLIFLSGCISSARRERRVLKAQYDKKIIGWEYIRIEKQIPDKDCIYKIQEACGEKNSFECYNWFKQRAKFYGANTVVITEAANSRTVSFKNIVGPTFKSAETITALADYYYCPKSAPVGDNNN